MVDIALTLALGILCALSILTNHIQARRLKRRDDKIVELSSKLHTFKKFLDKQGVCTECGCMFDHDIDQPFADCGCGTTEWGSNFTPFQKLQERIFKARQLVERLENNTHFESSDIKTIQATLGTAPTGERNGAVDTSRKSVNDL